MPWLGSRIVFIFTLVFIFCSASVFPQDAEQQGERYYLITGTELRSIEEYKANRERETQNWLLQVQGLSMKAENSEARSAVSEARSERLEADSVILNQQLLQARNRNVLLETLYNKSEAEKLTLLSQKNGEILELKQEVATQRLETEKYKGTARIRLAVIIALVGILAVILGITVYRFIRPKPKIF